MIRGEGNSTYSHQFQKGVVDTGTMRQEEAAPWAEVVEEEEFLILLPSLRRLFFDVEVIQYLANPTMISLGSLSQEGLVLRQLLFIGERNTVNSLESVVIGVPEEVRRRTLHRYLVNMVAAS